ncbi:MAG TPA: hypothetical protein VK470_16140 [Bacteroidota bacterium]|nr:hypothetical protein [Bacteroidota bacterium]
MYASSATIRQVAPPPKNVATAYQKESALNLSPSQVVLRLYDFSILHCKKRDKLKARDGVNALITGLNFEIPMATDLYKLYDYAKRCLRKDDFENALLVLEELRSAWAEAFKLN